MDESHGHNVVINKPYEGPLLEVFEEIKYDIPWIHFILAVGIADMNLNSKEEVESGDIIVGNATPRANETLD